MIAMAANRRLSREEIAIAGMRDACGLVMSRKPLRSKGLQPKFSCLRSGNSVELGVAAERFRRSTATDSTHSPEATREGPFMDATHELSPDEARPHIVDMLDAVRKQEQACALNKSRYMILARRYGLPVAEIAELLAMSETGVRKAIKRIEESTPDEVI